MKGKGNKVTKLTDFEDIFDMEKSQTLTKVSHPAITYTQKRQKFTKEMENWLKKYQTIEKIIYIYIYLYL